MSKIDNGYFVIASEDYLVETENFSSICDNQLFKKV